LKKNNKNLKIKISYDWEFFINFGNLSFPGSLDKEDYCDTIDGSLHGYDKCDNEILRNTLLNIREDFDFIFTYFGSVDECGHEKGFDNEEYRQYVGKINNFIEIIFDELKYHGIFDSTYIIITADHGVQPQTKWHGEWNDINIHIPWFIKGPNIKKNYQIKSKIKNADTAPTIMHIFGFEPSNIWRSKVVNEIFITEKERLMRRYKNKLK
jgi:predicted AlkP superfamily pyrophosphatase or phosphodiesterase